MDSETRLPRWIFCNLARWSGASPSYLAVRWTFCLNRWKSAACKIRSTEIAGVPSKHDPVASLADILENLERIESYVRHSFCFRNYGR